MNTSDLVEGAFALCDKFNSLLQNQIIGAMTSTILHLALTFSTFHLFKWITWTCDLINRGGQRHRNLFGFFITKQGMNISARAWVTSFVNGHKWSMTPMTSLLGNWKNEKWWLWPSYMTASDKFLYSGWNSHSFYSQFIGNTVLSSTCLVPSTLISY